METNKKILGKINTQRCSVTLTHKLRVVPEMIHTPPTEEISAVRKGREEKFVPDNSKY